MTDKSGTVVRGIAWGASGRRFKSGRPDQNTVGHDQAAHELTQEQAEAIDCELVRLIDEILAEGPLAEPGTRPSRTQVCEFRRPSHPSGRD